MDREIHDTREHEERGTKYTKYTKKREEGTKARQQAVAMIAPKQAAVTWKLGFTVF